jgi:hypothetical protein
MEAKLFSSNTAEFGGLKDIHTYSRVALSNSEGRFSSILCVRREEMVIHESSNEALDN